METYEGYGADVVIDADTLVLTRKGAIAKTSGIAGDRRIPLQAITGVRFKDAGRMMNGWLQLVLANEPPAKANPNDRNTVFFRQRSQDVFESLRDRLLAVVERNRELGLDPTAVEYEHGPEMPKEKLTRIQAEFAERQAGTAEPDREPGWLDRVSNKLDDFSARQAEKQRAQLVSDLEEAGITRPDLVEAVMAMDPTWLPREVRQLAGLLGPNETVRRLSRHFTDNDGGVLALTSIRLLVLNREFWSGSRTEFPLTMIASVSVETGILGHADLKLYMVSGQVMVLQRVSDIEEFANDLRDAIGNASAPQAQPQPSTPGPDVLDQLAKLAQLRDAGVVTAEEFEAKKAQLLDRL